MKFQHRRRRAFKYVFRKLYFKVASDVAIARVEEHSNVFLPELVAAILFVFWIIAVAFFVLLPVETAKELIYLFGFSVKATLVLLVQELRMQSKPADEQKR